MIVSHHSLLSLCNSCSFGTLCTVMRHYIIGSCLTRVMISWGCWRRRKIGIIPRVNHYYQSCCYQNWWHYFNVRGIGIIVSVSVDVDYAIVTLMMIIGYFFVIVIDVIIMSGMRSHSCSYFIVIVVIIFIVIVSLCCYYY